MLSIFILIILIYISISHNRPLALSGAFAIITALLSIIFGNSLTESVIAAFINFGLSWLLFTALEKFEGESTWWAIAIGFIFSYTFLTFYV